MSKIETSAAGKKAAYISPRIVCCAVEYLLCSGSDFLDSGHKDAEFGGTWEEENDDTSGGGGSSAGTWN